MKKALKNGPETNLYHLFSQNSGKQRKTAENRLQTTVLRFNSAFEVVRTARVPPFDLEHLRTVL